MRRSNQIFTLAAIIASCFNDSLAFLPPSQSSLSVPASRTHKHLVDLHRHNVIIDNHHQHNIALMASKQTLNDAAPEQESSWAVDPIFGSMWIGFIAFAILGPGEFNDPKDIALLQQYIDNPSDPGFSVGFQLIFNYLGIMPIILSCLAVPQAAQRGLPPLPFLVSGFAMGYGGVGPYLSFRAPPREEYVPAEASWFTSNILESKLLGRGLVAGVAFLPFYVGVVDGLLNDAPATVQGYLDLFAVSKFVSASSVDAMVLNVAAACLIPRDLQLRQPDVDPAKAKLIGASTLLLPFLGAALYCALRPSLPAKEE